MKYTILLIIALLIGGASAIRLDQVTPSDYNLTSKNVTGINNLGFDAAGNDIDLNGRGFTDVKNATTAQGVVTYSQLMARSSGLPYSVGTVYGTGSAITGKVININTNVETTVYVGSNFTEAVNYVMHNLTSGRTWKERVIVFGHQNITAGRIMIPSYTILENRGQIDFGWDLTTGDPALLDKGLVQADNVFDWYSTPDITDAYFLNRDIEVCGGVWRNTVLGTDTISFNSVKNLYLHDMTWNQPHTTSMRGIVCIRSMDFVIERINATDICIVNIVDGAKHGVVRDCTFVDTIGSPISIGAGSVSSRDTFDISVENNRMYLAGQTNGNGIDIFGYTHDLSITRNFIYRSYLDGIYIHSQTACAPWNIILRDNTCIGARGYGRNGVTLVDTVGYYPKNIQIFGGFYTYNAYAGIFSSGTKYLVISGVACMNNGVAGISMQDNNGGTSTNYVVANSVLSDNQTSKTQDYAIYWYGHNGKSVNHVRVLGNVIGPSETNNVTSGGTAPLDLVYDNNIGYQ